MPHIPEHGTDPRHRLAHRHHARRQSSGMASKPQEFTCMMHINLQKRGASLARHVSLGRPLPVRLNMLPKHFTSCSCCAVLRTGCSIHHTELVAPGKCPVYSALLMSLSVAEVPAGMLHTCVHGVCSLESHFALAHCTCIACLQCICAVGVAPGTVTNTCRVAPHFTLVLQYHG